MKKIWEEADYLVEKIRKKEPKFGSYTVNIEDIGAKSCDDVFSKEEERKLAMHNTRVIYKVIQDVAGYAEGGTVIIPAGIFYTGPIHLESRVNLHLEKGAYLRFATDTDLYCGSFLQEVYGKTHVLSRFEGVELMNYSPFLYAYDKKNIAITGEGTLDGQASEEYWHPWKKKQVWDDDNSALEAVGQSEEAPKRKRFRPQDAARVRLILQGEQNVPVEERIYGEASDKPGKCDDGYLRPSFIQPYLCENVLIEGVRIINSPMWEVHPVLCKNVTVRKVHIDTHLSNNDGVDPECCEDVLIEQCIIDVGDDCIAIKSGRNEDARRIGKKTENVIIQNNIFADGHGGITVGSEISGGVRNVFVRDNVMESPRLWSALRFKTNDIRSGVIENCYYKNNQIKQLQEGKKPVLIETQYEIVTERAIFTEHQVSYHTESPVIREIYIEGLTSEDADVRGDNIVADVKWQ